MQTAELMKSLLDLAAEVGLEVRVVRPGLGEGDAPVSSGLVRVKGRVWVVLSRSDPADAQIAVLARALVAEAGEALEARWLPPAVRSALEGASEA